MTLRKKAPFTCRQPGHHSHPLSETDGTLCPEHEKARLAAIERFNRPIREVSVPAVVDTRPVRRIWPD